MLLGAGGGLVAVGGSVYLSDPSHGASSGLAVILAFAWLVACATWLWRGQMLGTVPAKVGLAGAAPLALVPLLSAGASVPTARSSGSATLSRLDSDLGVSLGSDLLIGAALTIATMAIAMLCWELMRRVPHGIGRPIANLASLTVFGAALLLAWVANIYTPAWQAVDSIGPTVVWWVLVMVGIWLATAAALLSTVSLAQTRKRRPVAAMLGYVGIGLGLSATSFALAVDWWPLLTVPTLLAAGSLILAGRFAVGPLEAEAEAAVRERDLVVSTVEAERQRIVGEIHDGPITGLTLVVQRLDETGDAQGAELARSVAADLRSLSNELRVPVLEDLGAGPAIEWLSERIAQSTSTPIESTVNDDGGRPPAHVETAVFRVAQEALMNATKYGDSPVQVFYMAEPARAELTIIDAGPGIDPAARASAVEAGHLGLSLMAQRAGAIGAHLSITQAEPNGTCVEFLWDPTA